MFTPTFVDRFWAKVKKGRAQACWLWLGATQFRRGRRKVGRIRSGGRGSPILLAHRVALALHTGTLDARDVHHTCDNPLCCNPRHLAWLDPVEHRRAHHTQRSRTCPTK